MRRAALRGCALLLRRSGSAEAASEPAALAAAGLQAAAAAACGRQLWLQARLHTAAPNWQQGNSGGSSNGDTEWVGRSLGGGGAKRGTPLRVRPELATELRPLAALAGVADAKQLSSAVAAIGPRLEKRVIEHGAAVAELLLSQGVPQTQLAELLRRCPLLFSRPADERPALLFRQLARLGLTAAEAAWCFVQFPTAAGMPSFEPAIAVLAPLFAAGSKAGSGKSGEQLLGDFLRRRPAAVGLLCLQPSTLQQQIDNLVQRYGPHWKPLNKQAVVVQSLAKSWVLLYRHPRHLLALEAVLQQEVGQQPGDGTRLLACILQRQARAANCNPETLRQRVQALLAEFGQGRLLHAGPDSLAELLAVDTAVWQRALAVWRLLGVADPAAFALGNTRSLVVNWLAPERLASLAALQQLLPAQPSVADAVQHFSGYIAAYSPRRLISRLLFLQQEGALPLLVSNKQVALQQWRQQHGLLADEAAVGEPQFYSLSEALSVSDAGFSSLPALSGSQQQWHDGQAVSSASGSVAERYRACMARLPQLPAYQQLLAAGAAESRRLLALLPPELVPSKKEQQQEEEADGSEVQA